MTCHNCGIDAPVYDATGLCPLCAAPDDAEGVVERRTVGGAACGSSELQNAALRAISENGSLRAAAKALGINHGTLAAARDGERSTTAARALGVSLTGRRRFAADVDEATQKRIARLRDATGLDNGGLLLAALDMLEGELMRGVYPATAPAVTHAASQSPESVPPHPHRQSSCLPLR